MADPKDYRQVIEWSSEDKAFLGRAPAFAGVSAHGDTPGEAAHELGVALALAIDAMRSHGDPLPSPDAAADYSGRFLLRIPASLHRTLSESAAAEGTSLNQYLVYRLSSTAAWPGLRRYAAARGMSVNGALVAVVGLDMDDQGDRDEALLQRLAAATKLDSLHPDDQARAQEAVRRLDERLSAKRHPSAG